MFIKNLLSTQYFKLAQKFIEIQLSYIHRKYEEITYLPHGMLPPWELEDIFFGVSFEVGKPLKILMKGGT